MSKILFSVLLLIIWILQPNDEAVSVITAHLNIFKLKKNVL